MRKLRSTVAAKHGTAHTAHSFCAESASDLSVLDGLLIHDSRELRNSVRDKRDTNANRKNGGTSTFYRQKEGFGQ
jgi:hypothetical protein